MADFAAKRTCSPSFDDDMIEFLQVVFELKTHIFEAIALREPRGSDGAELLLQLELSEPKIVGAVARGTVAALWLANTASMGSFPSALFGAFEPQKGLSGTSGIGIAMCNTPENNSGLDFSAFITQEIAKSPKLLTHSDSYGGTPLHYAICNANLPLVRLLLSLGELPVSLGGVYEAYASLPQDIRTSKYFFFGTTVIPDNVSPLWLAIHLCTHAPNPSPRKSTLAFIARLLVTHEAPLLPALFPLSTPPEPLLFL